MHVGNRNAAGQRVERFARSGGEKERHRLRLSWIHRPPCRSQRCGEYRLHPLARSAAVSGRDASATDALLCCYGTVACLWVFKLTSLWQAAARRTTAAQARYTFGGGRQGVSAARCHPSAAPCEQANRPANQAKHNSLLPSSALIFFRAQPPGRALAPPRGIPRGTKRIPKIHCARWHCSPQR